MKAFKDSAAHVFVVAAGVAVAAGVEAGALGVESPAGFAEAPVPPEGVVGFGEAEDEDAGFVAPPPTGVAVESAASEPG
ncbi:hypothetical protein ACFCYX_13435 [Streptomyces populi]|uniref:hypothetical protein n=1 Tax=Streptomyces populi TaxID=2058924 RepID=UPI0035DE435E